jgi:hypothetical protein
MIRMECELLRDFRIHVIEKCMGGRVRYGGEKGAFKFGEGVKRRVSKNEGVGERGGGVTKARVERLIGIKMADSGGGG